MGTTESKVTPFLLLQGPFSYYNSLAEANAALTMKFPGLMVYIIPEDRFYYWDGAGWVLLESSGMGPVNIDAINVIVAPTMDLISTNVQNALVELQTEILNPLD